MPNSLGSHVTLCFSSREQTPLDYDSYLCTVLLAGSGVKMPAWASIKPLWWLFRPEGERIPLPFKNIAVTEVARLNVVEDCLVIVANFDVNLWRFKSVVMWAAVLRINVWRFDKVSMPGLIIIIRKCHEFKMAMLQYELGL